MKGRCEFFQVISTRAFKGKITEYLCLLPYLFYSFFFGTFSELCHFASSSLRFGERVSTTSTRRNIELRVKNFLLHFPAQWVAFSQISPPRKYHPSLNPPPLILMEKSLFARRTLPWVNLSISPPPVTLKLNRPGESRRHQVLIECSS